jgi:hypothetical protein
LGGGGGGGGGGGSFSSSELDESSPGRGIAQWASPDILSHAHECVYTQNEFEKKR